MVIDGDTKTNTNKTFVIKIKDSPNSSDDTDDDKCKDILIASTLSSNLQ
jgi:hypothetical protein